MLEEYESLTHQQFEKGVDHWCLTLVSSSILSMAPKAYLGIYRDWYCKTPDLPNSPVQVLIGKSGRHYIRMVVVVVVVVVGQV